MLLSGIAAVFRGLYGRRNHRWMAEAGLEGRTVPQVSRGSGSDASEPGSLPDTEELRRAARPKPMNAGTPSGAVVCMGGRQSRPSESAQPADAPSRMASPLHRTMTAAVRALGHPASLVLLLGSAALWRVPQPSSFDPHSVATLVAVSMTWLIQRGQNRDTAAMQAKLDELILASNGARNRLAGLDEDTADDIEEIRRGGR
jgi:low affinity Fe/Cu permease